MLRTLPYDAEVAYALHYLGDDLDKAWNPLALTLASEEHAPLVKALQQGTALKALHSAAVISIGGLFESGMKLASMQRYLGNDGAAELTVAELRQAVSGLAALPQRDAADVASANLRYELLDRPLPAFSARNALPSTGTGIAALRNGFGKATVFVLFPDWCVHCRKMMKTLAAFTAANAKVPVYAYGLEFHEDPADGLKPPSARALEELRGTPILRVNASVAAEWGASDFPFGVVTDGEGIIRFAGAIPADGFKGDGYVQRVIERMYSTPEPEMQGMER